MTEAEIDSKVLNVRRLRDMVMALTFQSQDINTFKTELIAIVNILIAVDYHVGFAPYSKEQFESYLKLVEDWLTMLRDAFDYRLNPEMSFCIGELIKKWDLQGTPKLVIFTKGNYSVKKIKRMINTHRIDFLLDLSQITGVQLSREPIFIQVPDDYKEYMIANAPLLHEVGHFVDRDNCVTEMVFDEIMPKLRYRRSLRIKQNYFPRYEGEDIDTFPEAPIIVKSHIEEYVADIFGAQYAKKNILGYLKFLQSNDPNRDSKDHPSLNCRKRMVDSFMAFGIAGRTSDILLASILKAMNNLSIVECPYNETRLNDEGLSFDTIDQLFSVYSISWDFILREANRERIRKEGRDNYNRVLNLPYYQSLDTNIKRATRELMNRMP